jgi:hypothetical protein
MEPTPFQKPVEYSRGIVACVGTFGFAFPNVQND